MAKYLLLIYQNEADLAQADAPVFAEVGRRHAAFGQANGYALRDGQRLATTDSATSIRHGANGEISVTDGAFVETKEALGGYYLIEADDLDQALAIAKQVPTAFGGGVEVRPILPGM